VALAVLAKVRRFTEPEEGYWGWLKFEPRSIRVFDPVDADEMRQAWPDFDRFSHAKLALDPAGYPAFERQLTGVRPQTRAEEILAAAGQIAGPGGVEEFSRRDIRELAGIARAIWANCYDPIFQGMRADQPGGAPAVGEKFRNVFRQVSRGIHAFTKYGKSLVLPVETTDGPAAKDLAENAKELDGKDYFSPANQRDERKRRLQEVVQRRGQPKFRRKLLAAYNGKCAVTGCDARPALEAAHILPYTGEKSSQVSNGLLLRSDIHTLFDLDLLGIDPETLTIALVRSLHGTRYNELVGEAVTIPADLAKRPNATALKLRWKEFTRKRTNHGQK
jgi:hypothetical protein